MRTASQLTRNCGLITRLSKARPRSPAVQATADEGTRFGKLVQAWVEGRDPQPPEVLDDPWCWYENMRAVWTPPSGVRSEMPLGLRIDGEYVDVVEERPHVYVTQDPGTKLATAGRADLVWRDELGRAVVADLKRSAWRYGDPAQHPQLMALGCAFARKLETPFMRLGLYDARDGFWTWSDAHVDDVLTEVLEMCALPEDEPRPGEWCSSCWERKACPAGGRP